MNVVFIDSPLALSIANKNLQAGKRKIPFRLIDIVIISQECSFDSKTLIKLCAEGITLIFMNPKTYTCAITSNITAKNTNLKIAQYESLKNQLFFAKYFLSNKIINHSRHLLSHNIKLQHEDSLEKIQKATSIESLLGIEGSFAKEYFHGYFSLFPKEISHGKRSKRPPLDPVNATLSYVYTILYNLLSVKLLIQGFELGIGYLHKPFRTHNALSSDLTEMFRHEINEFVYSLFSEKILTMDCFYSTSGVYLSYKGRKALYPHISQLWENLKSPINLEITNLKKHYEN